MAVNFTGEHESASTWPPDGPQLKHMPWWPMSHLYTHTYIYIYMYIHYCTFVSFDQLFAAFFLYG